MDPAPFVTVVVPVYNQEGYLSRCFDSLLAQTFPDWEAILVDDGSTDGSGAVCDAYAAKDSRFRVIHKPNGGVCTARNAGLRAARTEFVTLLDQDDMFSPLALELCVKAQLAYPEGWIFFRCTEALDGLARQPGGAPPRLFAPHEAAQIFRTASFPPPWCKLYRTSFLRKHDISFNEQVRDGYEDRPFVQAYLRAFWGEAPNAPVVVLPERLYYWEQGNPDSVSKRRDKPLTWEQIRMFDELYRDCTDQYGVPLEDLIEFWDEAVNILAFGITCLDGAGRRGILREYYASSEYRRLLSYFETVRHYNAFYLPFKYRQTWLLRLLTNSRLGSKWFFWKCYWLGFYLLGSGWRR